MSNKLQLQFLLNVNLYVQLTMQHAIAIYEIFRSLCNYKKIRQKIILKNEYTIFSLLLQLISGTYVRQQYYTKFNQIMFS